MIASIYRYQLDIGYKHVINLPSVHFVLSCAPARDSYAIDMWVEVHESDTTHDETFFIVGTGHPMPTWSDNCTPETVTFVGTCVMSDGFVWHLYKKGSTL